MSQSLPLFRAFQLSQKNIKVEIPPPVAIPSFIQGISTAEMSESEKIAAACRNPFLYSGHFNLRELEEEERYRVMSQSLPLFRAFQPYERHDRQYRVSVSTSQSLPLFRAFQLSRTNCSPFRRRDGVAIPSFIQGISTRRCVP